MAYQDSHEESDLDSEYDPNISSPTLGQGYDRSPTESEHLSNQHTPTTFAHSGAGHLSPSKVITNWNADQCADWIANLGFEQYADTFIDENIDGEALVALQHDDLKDMGVASAGHRLAILKNIYNTKLTHNVSIEPDDYIPPSADANAPDANATQDDIARIINQIKLRDERLMLAEEELRTLKEDLNRVWDDSRRLREDVLPIIRMAKDKNQPLPTPDGITHNGVTSPQHEKGAVPTRRWSTRKTYDGPNSKLPSPTVHESSGLDPSAAAVAASTSLTQSMSSQGQASPHLSNQPSPTSPPSTYGNINRSFNRDGPPSGGRPVTGETWPTASTTSTLNYQFSGRPPASAGGSAGTPALSGEDFPSQPSSASSTRPTDRQSQAQQQDAPAEFMKSFRVSMEEPCYKVLPVALKKYHINDDWRQYSLYIVHGDNERCLGLEERPLILFKQLASEGKKPMFMLRKHAAPLEGFANTRSDSAATGSSSAAGVGNVTSPPPTGFPTNPSSSTLGPPGSTGGARVQSYAGSVQLPGGVL